MNLQEKSQNFFQNYAFFLRIFSRTMLSLDESVGFGGRKDSSRGKKASKGLDEYLQTRKWSSKGLDEYFQA